MQLTKGFNFSIFTRQNVLVEICNTFIIIRRTLFCNDLFATIARVSGCLQWPNCSKNEDMKARLFCNRTKSWQLVAAVRSRPHHSDDPKTREPRKCGARTDRVMWSKKTKFVFFSTILYTIKCKNYLKLRRETTHLRYRRPALAGKRW